LTPQLEKIVINASPFILLFKSGQADLLPQLFHEVAVPNAVWEEVIAGGQSDAAATELTNVAWIRRIEVPALAPEILIWNLGDGESEVLNFALANSDYRAMIDDRAARNCARTLGIRTLGTGGALVLAKKRGLISSVSDRLQQLKDAGLWLSDEVVALLKEQAGEQC
jgi:predicted nucleic acid-binding protein